MLLRIFTALVLIPIVVALVWWGPAWVLAAVAALIAILALLEFFDLGERIAMRPFRKWTIVCTAGLFYAQYSLGLVETRSLAQGYSIVRSAAGGVLSIEAVLLVFVFGAVAIGLATRWALHEVLPAIAISSAALLFVALPFSYLVRINEITSGRPEAGAVYALPHLGGRHSRVLCRQGTGPCPHGARPEPQENLGGCSRQLARIASRGSIFCEVAADRSD